MELPRVYCERRDPYLVAAPRGMVQPMRERSGSGIRRRDFLQCGVAATLGAAALPLSGRAADPSPAARGFRRLGRTGLEVSDISFGSSRSGDPRLVEHALERGINYFDTAESYRGGAAEKAIGRALRGRKRESVSLASKTLAGRNESADELMRALDGSLRRLQTEPCSPAFGGHPASIVPAAYSSVPKTGQNRRTSRPHLALRGTRAPPTCTRTCAFEGPLGSPRRAIQPSSREKTAHDLRVGELQWPPEDGENVTNRTVNAPLKTGQNAEIGNAAVRAASGARAARARLPITVIDRQSLGEALAWWRKSYAT